jgi:hypothetical protein
VQIQGYESIIRAVLDRVFGPKIYPLITSIYSLAVLIIVPILAVGVVFELSGKRADRRRVRDLPAAAQDFLFGREAWEDLFRQETVLADEKAKRLLFDRCRALEMKISRREFLSLYEEMKKTLSSIPQLGI